MMRSKKMTPEWMNDPEAFSADYDEWLALVESLTPLEMPEDDCPLDGDAESALASAGFGTDEDYGGFTHDWEDGM
jgi:hypothetical protein